MPKKILVIDDDQTNVSLLQSRLRKAGYHVIIALDGDVGLDRAKKETPDLIILDVDMPRMNGYSFMLEMGKFPDLNSIQVIVLTSHDEMQPIFQLKKVKGYLVKPVDFDKLFEKISNLIGRLEDVPPSASSH